MTSALSFANTIHTNTHSHSPRQDDEDALSNHQDQPPQLASQEIACFHKEPYALAPPGVAPLLGMQQQLEASQRPMTAALRLLLLVLLLVLPLTEAFVRLPLAPQRLFSQTRPPPPSILSLPRLAAVPPSSSEDGTPSFSLPPGLQELQQALASFPADDDKAKTLYLVSLGDRYAATVARPPSRPPSSPPAVGRRVPGCVSVVHMIVTLSDDLSKVWVDGTSDARVSYGLVALVSQGLSGASPAEVLQIDPTAVAAALGLKGGMMQKAPGRQNGLANIVKTVQEELKARMEEAAAAATTPAADVGGIAATIAAANAQSSLIIDPSSTPTSIPPASSPLQIPLLTHNFASDEVAVLLSGGVDSSVALHLLLQQGYKPRAFYLKIWLEDELAHLNQCPWEEDWGYASAVCKQAGNIPLEAIPMQKEYWAQVVAHTIQEAKEGRTPNPDILCNSLVKFGVFYEVMGKRFNKVATGHYARAVPAAGGGGGEGGPMRLMRSPDRIKDQTYFLSRLKQEQLARATFPIGAYEKHEIRTMAEKLDLPTKSRKDSQGICFLGKLRFDDFLRHYLGESPGEVVWLEQDLIVGRHNGLWFHTIGQRKGIVPVLANAYRPLGPWYVAAKDPSRNVLFVTNSPESLSLMGGAEEGGAEGGGGGGGADEARRTFRVDGVTWISGAPPPALLLGQSIELEVQIRHGPNSHPRSRVRVLAGMGGEAASCLEVMLPKEDSLAPGQYAAFYQSGEDGTECLGAGVISEETWRVPQAPFRLTQK